MLAGDFAAFTSPQCNGGRQVALRAPYVNNQINPALFSPAALNFAKRLPSSTDPCGQITYDVKSDRDEAQALAKIDYQLGDKHSIFGRYFVSKLAQPPGYAGGSDNVLKTSAPGADDLAHMVTFGDTTVLSSSMVNSLRFSYNTIKVDNYQTPFFSPKDLGANVHSYLPGYMVMTVTPGFALYPGAATKALFFNDTYQVGEDFTLVRGNHQFGIGGTGHYWKGDYVSTSRASGNWIFNGSVTGLGLADLLVGRVTSLEHGGLGRLLVDKWYMGLYAQDTWRASNSVTVNAGLRWEPYFGQHVLNNAISNFKMENFQQGIRSTVFHNAPVGFMYPGDPGFPKGQTGLNTQWWNLSPRFGVAWDVRGDGRTAVRSSYAMAYDFMAGEYHNINTAAPPFGNRSLITDPPGRMDDPYGHVGGDPHPIVTGPDTQYVPFGAFGSMDPGINSPRVQSWNVMLEQQIGTPVGTPGMFNQNPYPHQIVMKPGLFVHLIESDNDWRVVHTDGRPHKAKEDLEPLYNGDQVAHWEGDVLVIDTVSLDERTWINSNGWFHSDEVRVIERLRRPSMNYLEWQYTVEDPKVLTKPWTSAWRTYSLGNEDLTENFCTNNENVEQLRKLNEIESRGKR
jgi:hypothetical protein